ncbi:MAG: domain S-box [Firmicutes bacterium]|nr:domain S-box [Bacillota bacterium]
MTAALRLLNVEDSEDDALLLERHLSRAGYAVTMARVETAEAMISALAGAEWDVVVADYVLPRFSAPAALALVRERRPALPFILVSGAVGQETVAMAALRAGAQEYMLKTDVARFIHVIPLIAGVIAQAQRAATHLMLGKQYLEHAPGADLARATYHGEEALMMLQAGEPIYAPAVLHLARCYAGMGQSAEAVALLRRYQSLRDQLDWSAADLEGEVDYRLGLALERLGDQVEAVRALDRAEQWFERMGLGGRAAALRERVQPSGEDGEADRGQMHLERGRYFLLTGDLVQAVREAIMALHAAGSNSLRCFGCYVLLLKCAQKEGNGEDALNFGLSARMMAMDAQRHDLGYIATEALIELVREMGSQAGPVMARLEQEYRKWHVDIWQFLPDAIWGAVGYKRHT